MKLLSWNTKFARATARAVALASEVSADVVLLQEAQPAGLWSGALVGDMVPECDWGSWILAGSGELESILVPGYSGWVVGATWRNGDEMAYLFSVHVPTSSKQQLRSAYVTEARRIVAAICACVPASARLIVGGDFNFKSFGERLPSETVRTTRQETDALHEFRERGFSVAWRDCHSGKPLPQTLRWSSARSVSYHCDGFLVRGFDNASISCDVLSAGVHASDHDPLVLDIRGGRKD